MNGNGNGNFERWFSQIRQVVSFLLGCGILGYETLGESLDRPWLLAVATGLVAPPVAAWANNALEKATAKSNQIEPGGGGPATPRPTSTNPPEHKSQPEVSSEESAA